MNFVAGVCTHVRIGDGCNQEDWDDQKQTVESGDFARAFSKQLRKAVNYDKNVVFIDSVRTPFLVSRTDFKYTLPHELAAHAILKLMQKTSIPSDVVDYVFLGTVVQEISTTNIARESALCAGLPAKVPAHTIIQACIGGNQGMTAGVSMIAMGKADCVISGGVDVLSNLPIILSRRLRVLYFSWLKSKTLSQKLKLLSEIKPDVLTLQYPAIAEFSTGEPMGNSADKLAAAFKVSRREQDEYALRSHRLASEAWEKGYLSDVVSYMVPKTGHVVDKDNGIRKSTADDLSKLKPAFVRPFGTVTAGNSSYLTDGASVCLLMSESKAKELGLKPKAYLRNFAYKSNDPVSQPLISPADCISSLLSVANLNVKDIDVWEMHEAFAVLATLKALDSEFYCREHLNLKGKLGMVDFTKLNRWGGSLSIGHPFAATGTRLCSHGVNRLIREDGQLAMVAVCAAGGQGAGMLIERHPDGVI